MGQIMSQTLMGKYLHWGLVWNDTPEQKKKDLWGWRKQQQIRGLLHYYQPQGLLSWSSGTQLKRVRPWFFSSFFCHVHILWEKQSHYMTYNPTLHRPMACFQPNLKRSILRCDLVFSKDSSCDIWFGIWALNKFEIFERLSKQKLFFKVIKNVIIHPAVLLTFFTSVCVCVFEF